MNTSPPPESSSRSAAAPTRTTPGTIVIGSTCWAVMTPMIADPQTPRPSCVYYCTLRTPTPAIHHTKVHVKALDARLGALPCQESWLSESCQVRIGRFWCAHGRARGAHIAAVVHGKQLPKTRDTEVRHGGWGREDAMRLVRDDGHTCLLYT